MADAQSPSWRLIGSHGVVELYVLRLIRTRLHRSSGSVHPRTFTLSHEVVLPSRYWLASSFATYPS